MNNSDQYHIILKVLSNTASQSEHERFIDWLQESETNRKYFDALKVLWQKTEIKDRQNGKGRVFKRVIQTINKQEIHPFPRKKRSISRYWVAASLILLLSIIYVFSIIPGELDEYQHPISSDTILKENLSGQKSKILLSDGSKVWLNSESSVEYQKVFQDSIRMVKLTGEAYFEVTKENRPFIVETQDINIKVLGTSFNVSAFQDENSVVSLVSGKVEVMNHSLNNTYFLEPGWQCVYLKNLKAFEKGQIDVNQIGQWKDGILNFNNDSFETIIKRLERWYGVKFNYTNGKPEAGWRYTGKFDNEYLVNILDIISYGKGFTYSVNGNEIKLDFNR